MKVLLDECGPITVNALIDGHDVIHVRQMGWAGLKNGQLLAQAQDQFDV